jgi:acetylornithine deacetylase/succinyl-diaminopimelate desuccinylase-like protein
MIARRLPVSALCAASALALLAGALEGCAKKGDIVVDEGVGITAIRSKCPAVGVPDYTGDITTFRVPGDKTAANIDVVAALTNVRVQCNEDEGAKVYATVSFDVLAKRTDTAAARQVTLPYFVSVLQGGNIVASKRVGSVTINFAAGQDRAQAKGTGSAYVDRAAATLPNDIRERITRKRKPGDSDAATDPLADPKVRTAVARATFELLVGFQLTNDQLAYNATR